MMSDSTETYFWGPDFFISAHIAKVFSVTFIWIVVLPVCANQSTPILNCSQSETNPVVAPTDNSTDSSMLNDLDTKIILVILAVLLFVVIVVALSVLCWKCCRQSKPRSHHSTCHTYACEDCVRMHNYACAHGLRAHQHVCINTRAPNEISAIYDHARSVRCQSPNGIATIYDPGRCSHCLPGGTSASVCVDGTVTPPPAYPTRTVGLGDATRNNTEAGFVCSCGGEVSREVFSNAQQCAFTQTSPATATRDVSIPLTSQIRNDVTAARVPENGPGLRQNPLFASLTSSRSSNTTSDVAFYTPNDENVVLGEPGSQASLESRHASDVASHQPLNIECPGLFETFPAVIRDLLVPGQRSERRTVAGKLVVSLAREVDHKGDHLVLDNMGISLWIPPGAIPKGQRQLVCLVLNWDLTDFPPLDNRQALISPIVYCGPHGLQLNKPAVLSYKHCAFDTRMVEVLSSQTELVEQKDWQVMCSAEDNSGTVAMTTNECQIRLQHFSLFTSVQTPPEGAMGKKWLQVAAFCAPLQREVHHYQVRVYFLNKTPCAMQWAIQNEAKFGFRLACPERTFLFEGSGEDMHLIVGYISRGWCAIKEDHHHDEQGREVEDGDKVSYYSVWHGKCPYISFCFKRTCIRDQPTILTHNHGGENAGRRNGSGNNLGDHSALGTASERRGARGSLLTGVSSDSALPGKMPHHVSEINLDFSLFQDSHSNTPEHMNLLLTEPKSTTATSRPFLTNPDAATFPKLAEDSDNVPSCGKTHLFPTCHKHGVSISMPAMQVESGMIRGKVKIDPSTTGSNVLVDFEREYDCIDVSLLTQAEERAGVFPHDLKLKLKLKLDPQCPFGNDWRLLASRVGLDSAIRWLTAQDSPTMRVLSYMENMRMDLGLLHRILQEMGRLDAAADVEKAMVGIDSASRQEQNDVEHTDHAVKL